MNDGKFTAAVDGIYFFSSQALTYRDSRAWIYFYVNGSSKSYVLIDEGPQGEYDIISLSSQFKLNKGDTFWVYFEGNFHNPQNADYTFLEGHLIRQINS